MRLGYTITSLNLNSKAYNGNMPLLRVPGSSRCRHQLARLCAWDAEDVLLIDFVPHKVTVTWVYYGDLLHKLLLAIKEKR